MRIAVMQPYLFPYIGYFQLMHAVNKFIFLDDVSFINRGWINRNRIIVNGKEYLFTIPLEGATQNRLIKDIDIVGQGVWKQKLIKTIELSYKKAPFFSQTFSAVSKILSYNEKNLSRYLYYSLKIINQYLSIKTELIETSSFYQNVNLKGQDKILDICIKENASGYINPIGGIELYDKKKFKDKNIDLYFIKSDEIVYNQFNDKFVPGLSIIDVMMFNSPEKIKAYLNRFTLI